MFFLLQALWVSSYLTVALCAAAIFWRNRQTQLPIFTGYLLLLVLQFCVLFTIAHRNPFPQETYHWAESVCQIIGTLWTLGVIYELMSKLLLSRRVIVGFSRGILQIVLGLLVLASVAGAGSLSDWSVHRISNISDRLDFCSNLILTGMFLTMAILQRSLRLSWRNWITGIAVGFGTSAPVSLAAAALRAGFGKQALMTTDIFNMAGFQACALIWLIYLMLPDRPVSPTPGGLQQRELERWSEELERIVPR